MSEPAKYSMGFEVPEADIDLLGHASNIAIVRWIQDVALAHSAAVGLGFEGYQRLGAVFVVVRHEIDYLRPALRAEALEARTWISSVMAAKCIRSTEIVRVSSVAPSTPDEARRPLVARAQTTWGFVEMATGRPRRIPAEVRAAFEPFIHAPPSAAPAIEAGRT